MARLHVLPYTIHRDWNDVEKFDGVFHGITYQDPDEDEEYNLVHHVVYAQPAATGPTGTLLDPLDRYLLVKNMGTVPVLVYLELIAGWWHVPVELTVLPGKLIEVVDLDLTTPPRFRVDSALYTDAAECEVLQIGKEYVVEQPEAYCDAWAVGHIPSGGCGTKHYPEVGVWASVANGLVHPWMWFSDVAGTGVHDYWACGYFYDDNEMVYAGGLLAWYNGIFWDKYVGENPEPPWYGIWGFAASDYYVVGGFVDGEIWHYDGLLWSQDFLALGDERLLRAVHGYAPTDVWAVGDAGAIWRRMGGPWVQAWPVEPPILCNLYGVWADSDVFAVTVGGAAPWWLAGPDGCAWVYDGIGWAEMILPEQCPTLRACWGFSPTAVWAVGDYGTIVYWDGATWETVPEPQELEGAYHYRGVFGCDVDQVWAIGTDMVTATNVIIEWDGIAWSVVHGPTTEEMELLGLKGVQVSP